MLEGLAAWILNTYVGEYVENLNTTQLSIALLQGAVELENLPLKRDALKSLDLPLQVKSGFIGNIKLQIPLHRLRSEPWVISIKRLYLVAGPLKHSQFSEEKEKEYEREKKKSMLDALEEKWQLHKEEKQESYGSSWFSYGTSVATNILENLQLKVEDVHIRYEDDELVPTCPFAFGVVIKSLSAQSTDESWSSKSSGVGDMMYKLVDLQNFSMYLDTDTTMMGNLPQGDLADALQREMYITSTTKQFKDHEYILSPVCAQTRLKRNTSSLPLRLPTMPRISLDVSLEKMEFCLSEDQYHSIIQFLKEMERYERRRKNRKWRPSRKVSESAKEWWKYAITAHLDIIQERNRKLTKTFLTQRVKDICFYHQIYTQYLMTQKLDASQMSEKVKLEECLNFDEIKILREVAYYRVKQEDKLFKVSKPEQVAEDTGQQTGILQRWFPGWGGWYGSTSPENVALPGTGVSSTGTPVPDTEVGEPPTKMIKSDLDIEQELMDVIHDTSENTSFLKKDTVFACMNFKLESGVFRLLTNQQPGLLTNHSSDLVTMLELECSAINMLFESRPRSKAMKFGVSVGGFYLRDKLIHNSIFPNLISPQPKERILSLGRSPHSSFTSSHAKLSPSSSSSGSTENRIFELLYEKNPVNSTANYRLNIQTKPLDIFYNPSTIKRVREFFSTKKMSTSKMTQLKLTANARRQYQILKEQTKAEIRQTLDQLLEGEEWNDKQRWDVNLDISAPQIIVPENFSDASTNMVVLDFGHLHFYNRSINRGPEGEHRDDNDDDFQTPLSTPPNEVKDSDVPMETDSPEMSMTEAQLFDKLYEKYSLDLSDLQVMVGKPKDNWKHARGRGSTHLHVVDKFSINLQFERRLIYTSDPQWPSMTVSGNLPSLTLHVNESKVSAMRTCVDTLTTPTSYTNQLQIPVSESVISMTESVSADFSDISDKNIDSKSPSDKKYDEKLRELMEESCLLMGQFSISSLKLEIHSTGRPLAELQVTNVKANVTKRPYDSSVKVSVHSLLIVDALQTYGPDFELLVASHKHVTLDSKSGSLLGSDPSSPMSTASPNYPQSPAETVPPSTSSSLQALQDTLSNAFQSLMNSHSVGSLKRDQPDDLHRHSAASPTPDSEALITLDIDFIDENSSSNQSGCPLKVANIQFNSLDIIGNQETMMELLNFTKNLFPQKLPSTDSVSLNYTSTFNKSVSEDSYSTQGLDKIEVTADFNRLNLLVMRIEEIDGTKQAHKVVTATMSSARVQATIDKDLDVSGSLGGFHIMDVSADDVKHQQVFSVGCDHTNRHIAPPPDLMYKTANESMFIPDTDDVQAFSFHLLKGIHQTTTVLDVSASQGMPSQEKVMNISLQMASICYIHSPKLLHDIADCFSDFKEYTSSVASSIKTAASEVANKMVNKKSSDSTLLGSTSNLNETSVYPSFTADDSCDFNEETVASETKMILNAQLETPVIVIPRTPVSSEVLVAHLGQISITNSEDQDDDDLMSVRRERLTVEAKNMNLYAVDIDKSASEVRDFSLDKSTMNKSYYNQSDWGTPIVHQTTVEIVIDLKDNSALNMNHIETVYLGEDSFSKFSSQKPEAPHSIIEIMARIATPIKLELSKGVYEQILQTVDNLTYDERLHGDSYKHKPLLRKESSDKDVYKRELSEIPEDTTNVSNNAEESSVIKPLANSLTTKINFDVPLFNVELKGDFDEGEKGLVDLKLHNFSLKFEKNNSYCTDIEIQLQSLMLEDLLAGLDSDYKYLLISRDSKEMEKAHMKPKMFHSHSCPDSTIFMPVPLQPSSLPSSFHENLHSPPLSGFSHLAFLASSRSGSHKPSVSKNACPQTPPPSVRSSRRVSKDMSNKDDLVHIKVQLVDKNSSEYTDKYNRTNRFIDVDFNCLDANVNLQTWVVLLDFLGMGAKIPDASKYEPDPEVSQHSLPDVDSDQQSVNSVVNFSVKCFTLILNKPEYELSRANVENLSAHINLRDENLAVTGQLGNLFLVDKSPHGSLYRERFVTVGDQALIFDIFKYGAVDPNMLRDCDISVKLQMSSVRYVHTNRFQMEFVAFLKHFIQLQDVLGRYRAASAGKKITDRATRGSRIRLDINADSPIILLPHSSKSTDVLVADLGKLTVTNYFRFDGEDGTLSFEDDCKTMKRSRSQESLSSMSVSETSEFSVDSSSTFQPMSQSLFNSFNPPVTPFLDPMMQSVYGSLEHDQRSPESPSYEIFDPTEGRSFDSPGSPQGTSVDPEFFPDSSSLFTYPSTMSSQHRIKIHDNMREGKIKRTPSNGSLNRRKLLPKSEMDHICLLDVMKIHLKDMDLYSAERVDKRSYRGSGNDLEFRSCIVQKQGGNPLREKILLDLVVERNLEGDISHASPDFRVKATLSSVYCSLDTAQYKLVRGILDHNLGEKLPEFQQPLMSHLMDPVNETVLSGTVWQGISFTLDLNNVSVELLVAHDQGRSCPEQSLAKLDFICSTLKFDSFSDQSKDIDLVSNEIVISDTRYQDSPVNVRPNVFEKILQPGPVSKKSKVFQLELHYRVTQESNRFSVILNNMKLMCIFDWILSVQNFIMQSPDDPFKHENMSQSPHVAMSAPELSQQISRGAKTTSPVTVSSGIMTKRGPIVDEEEPPFELKLNVSDTQFIVVEDCTTWDTNAVILKSTAILNFRPKAKDKLLSCTLQSLEVFSCSLHAEEETAQSIIDPLTIHIDLNANPLPERKLSSSAGLLEASQVQQNNLILEINFNVMNIRLSYIDLKMFLAILNSIPDQALKATSQEKPSDNPYPVDKLNSLHEMGFSFEDCKKALDISKMDLTESAVWLTQHAQPEIRDKSEGNSLSITGVDLKSSCVCLCLIDDCRDSDVPLAELAFNSIKVHQKIKPKTEGQASFILTGDYYNRCLSGWEPFLEQWKCRCEWRQYYQQTEKKTAVQINAQDVLNLNITSTLLDLYNQTKMTWSEDYYRNKIPANSPSQSGQAGLGSLSCQKRRIPFVPFMLHNETGCILWFTTVTTSPARTEKSGRQQFNEESSYIQASDWKKVAPGDKMPFVFHNKEKIRHQKTHDLSINQLVVKVDGWMKASSVTVDRVGVYFRHVSPDVTQAKGLAGLTYSSKHDPSKQKLARIVFDVRQEGNARKVITVRSALIIRNKLDCGIDLKMAAGSGLEGKFNILEIPANGCLPVPLPFVSSLLYIRPSDWPVKYCNEPIQWQHVGLPGEIKDKVMKCETSDKSAGVYRFCVSVKREHYPEQVLAEDPSLILPGHTLSILPPVIIHSLLPCDLRYYVKNTPISGNIKPGKKAFLHSADPQEAIELGILLENFTRCRELFIPPERQYCRVKIRLYDTQDRLLELFIKIVARKGGCINLYVSAAYWLVNKSGLPLVFSQDCCKREAAGQYEEHELARSVTPLLFSYAEKDLPNLCTMRVGKSVKGPDNAPIWCSRFSLESGVGMRRLNIVPKSANRPDWIYNIGIEVRQGKGRYADTNIVTFAPRFEIDNQSSHKLAIAQRHIIKEEIRLNSCLTALPSCKLPFHWPRLDLDQLLCVRILDIKSCNWSGGFRIDKTDSFHINMRNEARASHLLKVEVVLQGPTYFIVFGDADEMPPPMRIDNLAEVPVEYFQNETTEQKLKDFVKPHSSLPYAWDEPMLDHSITLRVKSGTSATYKMDKLQEGKQLCYSNLIFLTASATFGRSPTENSIHQELVLEVVQDHYIKFRKKEMGNRNQLWRMTSGGMLEHEGSISPRDPHERSSVHAGKSMVLDIDDIAPRPGKIVPLTLRKRDERRKATQTWKFIDDGRLCCVDGALCVQTLGGVECLRDSGVAVAGPGPSKGQRIPVHMKISRLRLHAGSGCLSVRTVMDGPIRVLQIMDVSQRSVAEVTKKYEDWIVYEDEKSISPGKRITDKNSSLEICMSLKGGLGLSLVNHVPEELVYISLQNITLDYISNSSSMTIDVAVANIQVDNQLFTATMPVLLFVTQKSRRDALDNTPALHIAAHKIPNAKWNAEIYKHLIISMKQLSIQVEEQLLWKLLQFGGFGPNENTEEQITEQEDPRKALAAATSVQSKRYYFGMLKINTSRITLSMLTASKLSPDLKALKHDMSIPLVKFEEAKVDLDPFIKHLLFETSVFLQKEIIMHYTEELKSQAAKILGSVDFLGNPLGLFNDVTEGISGLINDGNVGGLLKNVTHGVSNSAAKVVGSLSDGLGTLNMDHKYQDKRDQIRQSAQSSGGHLVAGVKGFGNGLFGAFTSIFTQPYEGFKEEGVEGFITGIGKGVIGTVTKPVVGVLDLASGAANAIKDTSSSSSRISPPQVRTPRCCHGAGKLLPPYSASHAVSQKLLHDLNKKKRSESFIAVEQLRKDDGLMALITTEQVYFLPRGTTDTSSILLQIRHKELFQCVMVENKGRFYLELITCQKSEADAPQRPPQIRCDKQHVAQRVTQQINYARNLYNEQQHTLTDSFQMEESH